MLESIRCRPLSLRNVAVAIVVGTIVLCATYARAAAGTTAAKHLYVIDEYDSYTKIRIVGFPIDAAGVVGSIPDGQRVGASRVAIGPDGDLYLVGGVGGNSIQVFPPGDLEATAPIRTLLIPKSFDSPVYAMALDPSGYLYVGVFDLNAVKEGHILVFAPGASGNAPPVREIRVPELVTSLATDSQGHLFVTRTLQSTGLLTEFESPSTTPRELRDFCFPLGGADSLAFFAVGKAGGSSGKVFSFIFRSGSSPPYVFWMTYRSYGAEDCDRTLQGPIGPSEAPLTGPTGLVLDGEHMFVSDRHNGTLNSPAIFELDTRLGIQQPLAVISGSASTLHNPFVAAVGP